MEWIKRAQDRDTLRSVVETVGSLAYSVNFAKFHGYRRNYWLLRTSDCGVYCFVAQQDT